MSRSNSGRLPDFLIVGAAKAGTTSLDHYLGQHPDIFMSSNKEPEFFVWDGKLKELRGPGAQESLKHLVTDIDEYRSLFADASTQANAGEASTAYLDSRHAAARIRHHIPDAKLIAILRNPIDRAYSAYLHARSDGYEPLDFADALAAEPARTEDGWAEGFGYIRMGMYAEQLERYLALFPSEQMRVYLYDDLTRDPVALVRDVFRFLDVDPTFEPDVQRRLNRAKVVRSPRGDRLLRSSRIRSLARALVPARLRRSASSSLSRVNQRPVDPLTAELRQQLASHFEAEIHKLSRMLGRDLSPWLQNDAVAAPDAGLSFGMEVTHGRGSADSDSPAVR